MSRFVRTSAKTKLPVWLVDWDHPENNDFAIAEEVAVAATSPEAHGKRPDIVIYLNGIAVALLELKRSIVSVAEGIRQNLDNQKKIFIEHFFSTMQLIMAGNDTEGLRYGTIQTPEKYYLTWKEESDIGNPMDRALIQLCEKARLLDLIHNFVVFDAGTKKLCRHNQYLRRPRRPAICSETRRRNHLAYARQRQKPDDGLAGKVDSRERD